MTVARMDPEQARAWIALVSTAHILPVVLDEQLSADAGLTHFEYGILDALGRAKEHTLRMGELAVAVESNAPRLSKAVSRLERRGFVERVACPGDGRAVNIHLTQEGRRVWLTATPSHIELARDAILGGLTSEQLAALTSALEPLVVRLGALVGNVGASKSGEQTV